MKNVVGKSKIFFIVALVLIVAGMAILGFLGFNQSVDYKMSYEMSISVDQNVTIENVKSADLMKESAEKYFKDNGIAYKTGAVQKMDDGAIVIYKFSKDVSDKVDTIKTAVNDAIHAKVDYVEADVVFSEATGKIDVKLGWILIAGAVALVVMFLYALIMEKLAGAVATVFSALLSAILFVAVMSVARIPAQPSVAIMGVLSLAIVGALSITTVSRYKEELKNSANEKATLFDIVDLVSKKELIAYAFVLIATALIGIAVGVIGWMYLIFTGLQIILAGVCGVCSAFFGAPVIWTAIKGSKK